ncbi:MAG TPA: cobyrinate a,c-diamide synthase [Syntrophales bacterium]|nr:cobyrinate a,c-diamide synthase [Syntrophales bacterium]
MSRSCPRLVIGALRGSAGKTTLCAALAAAFSKRGIRVIPFKKGPDYIDAAWLAIAASSPCYNLDTFMMGRKQTALSFSRHALPKAISLVEGNRGLYDGSSSGGEHSTAELAKLIDAPVVLVVDCDKVTRTAAAMVLGCQRIDPRIDIRGVILNRVAGGRHEAVLRGSIERYCDIPVLGAVPRMTDIPFTERHLGLIPPQEHDRIRHALEAAAEIAVNYIDLERLIEIAESARPWEGPPVREKVRKDNKAESPVTVGVIRDRAFQFYYPENIEALAKAGARVVEISAIDDENLPLVDALYIGGGFPETQAGGLAGNTPFRRSVRSAAEQGLPIYAECGGLMFLGQSLTVGEKRYPMVGFLPVSFGMEKRPQGHGYTVLEVEEDNPFFPVGKQIKGHEFHYSRILSWNKDEGHLAFRVKRGIGMDGKRDGLCKGNVLATFAHVHAMGTKAWAEGITDRARKFRAAGNKLPSSQKKASR